MNPDIYRMVVLFVGAVLVLCVIGIIALSWGMVEGQQRIPDILPQITGMALTGLLGLIVNPRP